MTSDAIEVSGVKIFMFAIGRGSGVARRFESESLVANEPIDISILKPGKTTATVNFQNVFSDYSLVMPWAQSNSRLAACILTGCVPNASLYGHDRWITLPAFS
jgi:hypothetical protein